MLAEMPFESSFADVFTIDKLSFVCYIIPTCMVWRTTRSADILGVGHRHTMLMQVPASQEPSRTFQILQFFPLRFGNNNEMGRSAVNSSF